ncbi:hypothetical protein P3W45_001310 [Vairimorpha bombi]|jgi:regulator of chromosome condensation
MTVYVFGSNAISQFGLGEDYESTHIPTQIPFFDNVKIRKIKCGTIHTLVITEDNKLYSWGCNDEKALGRDGDESVPIEVKIPEIPVDITCGASISACLTKNNNLYVWGTFRNSSGVYGFDSKTRIQKYPKRIKTRIPNFKFVSLDSGSNFISLLNKNKTIWTFGSNDFYELGRRTSTRHKDSALFPESIFSGRNKQENHKFRSVRCGLNHGIGINTDNEVFTWGSNIYGQLGIGNNKETKSKHKINLKNVLETTGGEHHTLFLTKDGKLYGVGRNDQGQLGIPTKKDCFKPELINLEGVTKMASYENFSICQVKNKLYSFGVSYSGSTGSEEYILYEPTLIPFDFPEILDFSVGSNFTIVVTK